MSRVLVQARSDAYRRFGGDTHQLERYRDHMTELGFELTVCTEVEPDLRGFDLYHVNAIDAPYELLAQMMRARKHGIPLVLMTIHHRDPYMRAYYDWLGRQWWPHRILRQRRLKEALKLVVRRRARAGLAWAVRYSVREAQRRCLDLANVIVVNARAEAEGLESDVGCDMSGAVVVPNGVSPESPHENVPVHEAVAQQIGFSTAQPYAIVVGRIEPRKNQLAILDAVRESGLHVVFAGALNTTYRWYANAFRRALRLRGGSHVGQVSPSTLRRLMAAASVSVSASWFEVVPFGTIDSYASGARVVATAHSYLSEFVLSEVSYCDPGSPSTITSAVLAELNRTPDLAVRQSFSRRYSWSEVATRLADAYAVALAAKAAS